jgi:hypothetical protein
MRGLVIKAAFSWMAIGGLLSPLLAQPAGVALRLVYETDAGCLDTVELRPAANPVQVGWSSRSVSPCAVALGVGDVFGIRHARLLIWEGTRLVVMIGGLHRDVVGSTKQGEHRFDSGFGNLRSTTLAPTLLHGRIVMHRIVYSGGTEAGLHSFVHLTRELGVISVKTLDRENKVVGSIMLRSVEGLPLRDYVAAMP